MVEEILPVEPGKHNLTNYDEIFRTFDWKNVEKVFTWSQTGKMNIAYEAIDRHVDEGKGEKIALYYSDKERDETYSFADIKRLSNQAANLLKTSAKIKKGDRVFIFMPRSPEFTVALLGAIKLGAIAGPLFEAFMETAVRDRLSDSGAKVLVTTAELLPRVPVQSLPDLEHIVIVGGGSPADGSGFFIDYEQEIGKASGDFEIEWVEPEDGYLLHYTSGSTGKPKGALLVHYGMLQLYQKGQFILDFQDDDVHWCTADPGWITGTAYGMFAPWLNGVTTVVRGGRFSPEDWYQTIEKYGVTVWFSAPTAFRMLMAAGDPLIGQYRLDSLRHILSVGEPLNPEVVKWGQKQFQTRINDTWGMTETGGLLITNYPGVPVKIGSMGVPMPGVTAAIIDDHDNELPPYAVGNLAIKKGWPSLMRTIWNNEAKYRSYFTPGGWYLSGDTAYRDEDGYFWFQGRGDDIINTSGERVGPFEVESKLVEHPSVAEAGVIGVPDPLRGEIIKAFISLRDGFQPSDSLKEEIRLYVKENLAAHSVPRQIEFRDKLPKTRSGKIMRRVLKAWELGLPTGDLSTMED